MNIEEVARLNGTDKSGKPVEVTVVLNNQMKKFLRAKDEAGFKHYIESLLLEIKDAPSLRIDDVATVYASPVPRPIPKKYNTIVDVSLPYTLYLPNELEYEMQNPFPAHILLRKQWTERATGSKEIDLVMEKRNYYAKGTITSPKLPVDPTLGWEPRFEVENFEKDMDANGSFRYSRMQIEFDTSYSKKQISSNLVPEIHAKCLDLLNRFLRVYVHVTDEVHIQPLPSIVLTNIYFSVHDTGLLPVTGVGIRNAVINNAVDVIGEFKTAVETDFEPEVHALLMAGARASYLRKNYKMAVLESFQAVDVFVEKHVLGKFQAMKLPQADIDKRFEKFPTTKKQMDNCVKEIHGKKFSQLFPKLDTAWRNIYDNVRVPVVHKDTFPTEQQARHSVLINRNVIRKLSSL